MSASTCSSCCSFHWSTGLWKTCGGERASPPPLISAPRGAATEKGGPGGQHPSPRLSDCAGPVSAERPLLPGGLAAQACRRDASKPDDESQTSHREFDDLKCCGQFDCLACTSEVTFRAPRVEMMWRLICTRVFVGVVCAGGVGLSGVLLVASRSFPSCSRGRGREKECASFALTSPRRYPPLSMQRGYCEAE
jgi:hypothetical protein